MATPDDGLLALSYAPCDIDTTVRGTKVRVEVSGDYPFADEVTVVVRADAPVAFPLRLRVPGWATGADLRVDDAPAVPLEAGTLHEVALEWSGTRVLTLRLPAPLRVETRSGDAVTVHRGPLVFALAVGESWQRTGGDEPYADWEVHPSSPWNYALELDPADPGPSLAVERRGVGASPFSPGGAPLVVRATGRRLPGWSLRHGAADTPPPSPVTTHLAADSDEVLLAPYGSVRLRVTEVPWTPPQPTPPGRS